MNQYNNRNSSPNIFTILFLSQIFRENKLKKKLFFSNNYTGNYIVPTQENLESQKPPIINEKIKPLLHIIITLTLALLLSIIPFIIIKVKPEIEIIDYQCYTSDNTFYMTISLNNSYLKNGTVHVSFYDSSNNFVESSDIHFFGSDSEMTESSWAYISDDISFYSIDDYSFSYNNTIEYLIITLSLIILIPMFFDSLTYSYREFDIGNHKISVYAGLFHNTLRIDGKIYDKETTFVNFTPNFLSTIIDNTKIDVMITPYLNSVYVKANGLLINTKNNI